MESCRFVSVSTISLVSLVLVLSWMLNTNDNYVLIDPPHQKPGNLFGITHATHKLQRLPVSHNMAPNELTELDLSLLEQSSAGQDSYVDYDNFSGSPLSVGSELPEMDPNCLVNILIFKKGKGTIGRKQGLYKCKELGCQFRLSYSDDPKALKGKDIVLLYLRTKWNWNEIMKERPPGQIWILYCRESPLHDQGVMPPSVLLTSTYNWTMTYRADSTILASYGFYVPGQPEIAKNVTRNWAKQKTKIAAWMASNCYISGWKRTTFIKMFSRKYLKVDMFGKCGNMKCPKGAKCERILSKYKFYFALENSICKEYITEKFWRNALSYGSVPIVFGASKEDYERLAPPNSFIHLSDFRTPEELRDYLNKLDKNDTLYNQYFEWKKEGSVELMGLGRLFLPKTFCKMAEKFLKIKREMSTGTVKNELPPLKRWWSNSCGNIDSCPVVKRVLNGN